MMHTYAVETDRGWFSVRARGHKRLGVWMFRWFIVYDSNGDVVRKGGL